MVLWMIIPVILLIDYAYTYDYQNQGRYIMPALIPIMYYAVGGLQKLASLSWVPAKWGKTKKYLTVLANVAVYAAVACGILF